MKTALSLEIMKLHFGEITKYFLINLKLKRDDIIMFKIRIRMIILASMFIMLFLPLTNNVTGYVEPADYFQIPEGSAAATIDGVRDTAAGTYTTSPTESGTYLDIWAFNYTSYLYFYIEVLGDTSADDGFDFIALCFEKDHDNVLEANDEAVQFTTGMGGSIDQTWDYNWTVGSGWEATSGDTFLYLVGTSTSLQNGHRAFEMRLYTYDCGWSPSDDEFGFYIEAGNAGTDYGCWPDDPTGDWENIDYYGEVADNYFVSEFPIQNVLLFAIPIIFLAGIALKTRKN